MLRLPSIIPYMASRQNFSCRSCKLAKDLAGFCVFKISAIVHNTYCVKCSLSYTANYTEKSEKSSHLLADSSINNS